MNEMREFLLAEGWIVDPTQGAWQWHTLEFPAAWYRLKDAYSLAKSMHRQKKNLTPYSV